ncbi:hypothetical protein [Nostoc sp. MG11]|nr:hypothetical protein [Nostoc sp. MG11]
MHTTDEVRNVGYKSIISTFSAIATGGSSRLLLHSIIPEKLIVS